MPKLKRDYQGLRLLRFWSNLAFKSTVNGGVTSNYVESANLVKETLTVPNHRQLDTPGTCRAIYRQACRYIPEIRTLFIFLSVTEDI